MVTTSPILVNLLILAKLIAKLIICVSSRMFPSSLVVITLENVLLFLTPIALLLLIIALGMLLLHLILFVKIMLLLVKTIALS